MSYPSTQKISPASLQNQYENTLKFISSETPSETGNAFFNTLAKNLAKILQVKYVLIARLISENPHIVRTQTFWADGKLEKNFSYPLENTPCEKIYRAKAIFIPDNIQEKFPEDLDLQKMEARSYLGIPLLNSQGNAIGHLSVIDNKAMPQQLYPITILKVFAARTIAEMDRQYFENELNASNKKLIRVNQQLKEQLEQEKKLHIEKTRRYEAERRALKLKSEMTKLKQLERELLKISDREQQRIGQDLHDGLGQQLTGIAFMAKALANKLQNIDPESASKANIIVNQVNETIEHASLLAKGLTFINKGPSGLADSLKELGITTQHLFYIPCQITLIPENIKIHDESIALNFHRIAQEAVNNAVKHARCSLIEISLIQKQSSRHSRLVLSVKDNGRGFSLSPEEDLLKGMGIHIMRHRAKAINAILSVSSDSRGTEISCHLELAP
jgi:signal transduction histidine kinase